MASFHIFIQGHGLTFILTYMLNRAGRLLSKNLQISYNLALCLTPCDIIK